MCFSIPQVCVEPIHACTLKWCSGNVSSLTYTSLLITSVLYWYPFLKYDYKYLDLDVHLICSQILVMSHMCRSQECERGSGYGGG